MRKSMKKSMKTMASLMTVLGLMLGLSLVAGCGGSGSAIPSVMPPPPVGLPVSSPQPPLAISPSSGALPGGQVGTLYNARQCHWFPAERITICTVVAVAINAGGGVAPFTLSWVAATGSSLPPGLSLAPNAGGATITGIPTLAGTYNFVVTVTDSETPAKLVSATYTITII